tara:strand:+ start:1330 stop:1545 length:216 start_codon:yes stop_codon:yes gene_type:complete
MKKKSKKKQKRNMKSQMKMPQPIDKLTTLRATNRDLMKDLPLNTTTKVHDDKKKYTRKQKHKKNFLHDKED